MSLSKCVALPCFFSRIINHEGMAEEHCREEDSPKRLQTDPALFRSMFDDRLFICVSVYKWLVNFMFWSDIVFEICVQYFDELVT